jgi:hypothetical protein
MCFGGGTPNYTKKDYGALPSLGTGSASKTVTLNEAPAPMRGSRSGSSSSLIDETMAAARKSRSAGSVRPVARGQSQSRSLIDRGMLAIRYPMGRL